MWYVLYRVVSPGGQWSLMSASMSGMPSYNAAVVMWKGVFTIVGGETAPLLPDLDTVFMYDPNTFNSVTLSPLPHAYSRTSVAVVGQNLFILGGQSTNGVFVTGKHHITHVYLISVIL